LLNVKVRNVLIRTSISFDYLENHKTYGENVLDIKCFIFSITQVRNTFLSEKYLAISLREARGSCVN
jgi:hypothetical protein